MFKNLSIKTKLISIFVIFKVLPLILLAYIGISSFEEINTLLKENSKEIIKQSQSSIEKTTNLAIEDSIRALDKKSQTILEDKTVMIANEIADFLHQRDADIKLLSQLDINQKILELFFKTKNREVVLAKKFVYDDKSNKWVEQLDKNNLSYPILKPSLKDNEKEFHKVYKSSKHKKSIPIYKEITFYTPDGHELYKVSNIDKKLKDISKKKNTYLKAENYFNEAKKLKKGEIYVSNVIGEYVPSPIIGSFTKQKAKKSHIDFKPQDYAYAGFENPKGKKFEGIVRFVTPVYKNNKLQGYLTLALDHHHIMDFTDFVNPLSSQPLSISDASKGNYAFMWDRDFNCISHPRDYFIVGYDSKTGKKVAGWIDTKLEQKFKDSNETNLNDFLQKQTIFSSQSLTNKPNLEQVKQGKIGLDCKYLNFAPQCKGWAELTKDGGYGSFVIYWSGVYKLTTASTIPYYTGRYKDTKRGFGLVTIGANVAEFHSTSTKTKEHIDKLFRQENKNIEEGINKISEEVYNNIAKQIDKMSLVTLILIFLVIYVAILVANNITRRINKIIIGTQKLKENNFDYKIESNSEDELGKLTTSFNEMAFSINELQKNLKQKLYTDDLTSLQNRKALQEILKTHHKLTLFLVDIDSFKKINDFYGAVIGNFVLIEFAKYLKSFSDEKGLKLFRIGSDEFVIIKEKVCQREKAIELVLELNSFISSLQFKDKDEIINTKLSFTCGVSCGIHDLLEHADLALNSAKTKKVLCMVYDKTNVIMNKHTEYILWREKIQYAIDNDNIVAYFQPIVNVKNPEHKKYECLIRMIDDGKVISPFMFLDIAKEARLYNQLTKIMIIKSFEKFQHVDADFSVNLSMDDIENEDIVRFIENALNKYNVSKRLVFEILETEEINDFQILEDFIVKMRKRGIRFAIDDFGSGYSNFAYILKIRPDFLKIDGSLIKNVATETSALDVVKGITTFAKSLNMLIIAEFVSSEEIVRTLEKIDVDYFQGYYFSEPRDDI